MISFGHIRAQKTDGRQLIWNIGEAEMSRGKNVTISYPIMLSVVDERDHPELGTSTFRLFFDAGSLKDITVTDVQNGYRISGLRQSKDVFGNAFGFTGGGGAFVQFNILANLQNLIPISREPIHLFNINFTVKTGVKLPLCTPFVLDNNPESWGKGSAQDAGFLINDSGIVGTYYLKEKYDQLYLADDEVDNYLWTASPKFDYLLDSKKEEVGKMLKSKGNKCIQPKEDAKNAELLYFEAEYLGKNGAVVLNWETGTEFNNRYFDIQRSKDGVLFESIYQVKGKWNAVSPTTYNYEDFRLQGEEILYYRLEQVSNDGKKEFSPIRKINLHQNNDYSLSELEVSYFPNPTKGMIKVVSNQKFEGLELLVFDAAGRSIHKEKNVHTGRTIDLSDLSPGTYSLKLINHHTQDLIAVQSIVITQ